MGWDKKEQRWGGGRVWFKRAFGCAGFMGMFKVNTKGYIIQNTMNITTACKVVLDCVEKNFGCFVMCFMFCKQFAMCTFIKYKAPV